MGNNFECCSLSCKNEAETTNENTTENGDGIIKSKSSNNKNNNNFLFTPYSINIKDKDFSQNLIKIQCLFRMKNARNKLSLLYEKSKKETLSKLIVHEVANTEKIKQFQCEILYMRLITIKEIIPYNQTEYFHKKSALLSKFVFVTSYINIPENNQIYIGNWNINGKFHGYGILYTSDGLSKIEGIWNNGVLSGYGRLFKSNEYYEGEFLKTLANGEGVYHYNNNSIYQGSFADGIPNGKGKISYEDGSYFEGCFVNGEKVYGKSVWKNGDYYQGEIKNELFNGHGIYEWNKNRKYEGMWKDGKMDGKGKITYNDGSYYEGDFVDNVRCGQGKYQWNKDKYYEGEWRNGKQNGNGIYYKNGATTKGLWINGKLLKEEKKKRGNTNFQMYNSLHGNKSNYTSQDKYISHNSSIVMSSLDVNSDDQKSARKATNVVSKF